ncbi:hypothetical protein CC78DRAFT_453198 [Lojkania enalia]|uniref:C2H2-type domain-containing protein n=1 Tax=Lojkania enalia TaxID=147567 RepID=A0A9P4N9Z7_9PLEO|nr:hypothetical protein CC78DRAFT_453198 [Didymosphaeria enalia]
MACADTGSEENIISADLVAALRLPIHLESKQQFVLASGKVVQAIGQVTAPCGFGVDTSPLPTLLRCVFHVFVKLATPIIMGMAFLEETETMTKHRHRLVRVPRPAIQALQVYSLGRPRKNLVCYIDGKQALAVPDSGSDIDLMTPRFAIENGLQISHGEEMLEFADGTVAVTSGSVQVELAVNNFESSITRIPAVNFYLLDNFIHDVLIGADSVEELEVFTKNQHALVATSDSSGPLGLNRIRHLGALDRIVSWVKGKISKMQNQDATSNDTMENTLNDQYENDRRERETLRIAHLPLDEQESAMDAEARRQAEYNRRRTQPSSPSSSEGLSASSQPFSSQDDTNLLGIGTELASRDLTLPIIPLDQMYSIGYRCEHPGCTAAPFQTQYLLNSHMNVHSQIRPHYCPVKGCPRGEGGKGFKRKNEMIRHQLVHESPGYVCPFCPDREHKYPRPENLQRHVRVHHIDKDKDDPQLREVLAQRPEGGSRGRRRRT